jgi:hypothetical protein
MLIGSTSEALGSEGSVVSLPASVEISTDTWDVVLIHPKTSHSRSLLN